MAIRVLIRLSDGTKFPLDFETSLSETSVRQVKARLQELDHGPIELQRLIYKGRILDDDRTLSDYAIVHESTLYLVKSRAAAPSAAVPTPTLPVAPPIAATPSQTTTQQQPRQPTPMPPMGLMSAPGMMNPDNMSPEQMAQMMNSPLMRSLFDNPEVMRTMMEMNPQMRQLMDSNPQLREVLNNPQLLRQSLEMMRNPQAMQHMMRSQDLAMSQLENMPGGFSALSNMYRNVQEPMMEAMAPGGSNSSPSAAPADGANSLAGATGAAMPNPWGSSTSSNRPNGNNTRTTPSTTLPSMGTSPPNMPSSMMNNPWGLQMPPSSNSMTTDMNNPWGAAFPQPSPEQLEQTLQMLENPQTSQMLDSFLANPAVMQSLMESNPMMQQMIQQNPFAARMLQDPQVLRNMMQPDNIRAMIQMQQAMGGNGGMMMPPPFGFPSLTNNNNNSALDFSALLNQMQSTNLEGVTMQPQHPADRYRSQLQSLRDMGFDDEQLSLRAMVSAHGNLNQAVDLLLTGEVPDNVPGLPLLPPSQPESSTISTFGSAASVSDQVQSTSSLVPQSSHDSMSMDQEVSDEANATAPPKDSTEKKND